jgi:ribosomal subunit interface protein
VRIIVKGKNFDVPEADRAYAERKLRRLERLLDDRSEAQAEFSLERHKSIQDSHIVDVTLMIRRWRRAMPTPGGHGRS